MANGRTDPGRPDYSALLRFGFVAGTGWLIDALLLVSMVSILGVSPGMANVISSLTAAALVYLVSHHWVHDGQPTGTSARLLAYLVYTLLLILSASYALQLLTVGLERWVAAQPALVLAKVLITPPQFLLNFFVSRFLATKGEELT